MRTPLMDLDRAHFDVVVIGAGVNGASTTQHLAAAGFTTLLVEQNDFASGSSSRSSRLLHCGLRYLAPGCSMWEFAFHPNRLITALSMARQAMESRSQMVRETPERVRSMTFSYPIYKESPYAPWQIDLAFNILKALGPKDVPLDYRRLNRSEAHTRPLLQWLRDMDALKGIAQFREYRFEWPERIALDTVLDAARLGAQVRNHTALRGVEREADGNWRLTLADKLATEEVTVTATALVNTAGIWIDRVNRMADSNVGRRITGTKGEITIENSLGGGEGGVMLFDENNRNGKLVMKQRGYPASFIGEFADFCKVILDGKTPDAGPEVSLGELRTALAMYRSADSNRWENVWE